MAHCIHNLEFEMEKIHRKVNHFVGYQLKSENAICVDNYSNYALETYIRVRSHLLLEIRTRLVRGNRWSIILFH